MKSKKLSEQIIKTFKSNGFVLSEPDVLLDSEYIIQRSGENFRRSMLTFENEDGKVMCLRPDLTVASCIKYLEKKSKSKIYYSGKAYRRSNKKTSELINDQLGIEILGSKNKLQDDYKVIKTILKSAEKIKSKKIEIKVGDISLFNSLINSLDMPERWKLRLIRHELQVHSPDFNSFGDIMGNSTIFSSHFQKFDFLEFSFKITSRIPEGQPCRASGIGQNEFSSLMDDVLISYPGTSFECHQEVVF